MAAAIQGIFNKDLRDGILNSKVLVVGAGGIGCEVLKNLVLSGFPNIEIIDLDTIDLSNLNRQFLFHREHVGKSKAKVAEESVLQFNPNVKIKSYHDSITSTEYGINFFKQFSLVLSALDNRAARNHVNRMCLNAEVPLVESGTAGYNGQVELIKKGLTQCYECTPKATEKTFPGCTIRNTPSEPIHCIVWAKHLFNQVFGETVDDEDISPDMEDPEAAGGATKDDEIQRDVDNGSEAEKVKVNAESKEEVANDNGKDISADIGDLKSKEEVDSGIIARINTRQWAKEHDFNEEKLFDKFFYDDIKYLLSMSNLWKTRTPPTPLRWADVTKNVEFPTKYPSNYHAIWNLEEIAVVFKACLEDIKKKFLSLPDGDSLTWDKDDQAAMDFVAACANIRAHVFNIGLKTRFEIKSMAGNIIPAIATTNAITAGLVVMRAFEVLKEKYEKCSAVYVRLRPNPRQQILIPDRNLEPPNPKCYVCSAEPAINLLVDTKRLTIKDLRNEVLIKTLNMIEPEVTISVKNAVVISADEEDTEENNDKSLHDMQIVDGTLLRCDDFVQRYELTINIMHFDAAHDEPLFKVVTDSKEAKAEEEPNEKSMEEEDTEEEGPSTSKRKCINADVGCIEEDDLILVEDEDGERATSPASDLSMENEENQENENVVDLDSFSSNSDDKEQVFNPIKRKISVDDKITVLDSDDEEELGPTPNKRVCVPIENTNEVINID